MQTQFTRTRPDTSIESDQSTAADPEPAPEPPAGTRTTERDPPGSAAGGAPMTFDPFATDRLRNLADEDNAATPDPDGR